MQEFLFSMFEDDAEGPQRSSDQVVVCALNVQGAPSKRAPRLIEWALSTHSDVLVLSEVKASNFETLSAELQAASYRVFASKDSGSPYEVAVAVRGRVPVVGELESSVERTKAVVVEIGGINVRVLGMYAPTNGMTPDSSKRRQDWQCRFVDVELRSSDRLRHTIIAGDLNVLEPNHVPANNTYEAHDYSFYEAFRESGMTDAFRAIHPDSRAYSWRSDRLGAQRIDHTFVGPGLAPILCEYDPAPVLTGLTDHHAMISTIARDRTATQKEIR